MNEYGIVFIHRDGRVGLVLFPSLAAVEEYKETHAVYLRETLLWYVVHILERSQAEVAVAMEGFAELERTLSKYTERSHDSL